MGSKENTNRRVTRVLVEAMTYEEKRELTILIARLYALLCGCGLDCDIKFKPMASAV